MARQPKGFVLLLTTPPDWKPQSHHTAPPIPVDASTITVQLLAKGLSSKNARLSAIAFNRAHLGPHFRGQWAIACSSLKSRGYGTVGSQRRLHRIQRSSAHAPQTGGGI